MKESELMEMELVELAQDDDAQRDLLPILVDAIKKEMRRCRWPSGPKEDRSMAARVLWELGERGREGNRETIGEVWKSVVREAVQDECQGMVRRRREYDDEIKQNKSLCNGSRWGVNKSMANKMTIQEKAWYLWQNNAQFDGRYVLAQQVYRLRKAVMCAMMAAGVSGVPKEIMLEDGEKVQRPFSTEWLSIERNCYKVMEKWLAGEIERDRKFDNRLRVALSNHYKEKRRMCLAVHGSQCARELYTTEGYAAITGRRSPKGLFKKPLAKKMGVRGEH